MSEQKTIAVAWELTKNSRLCRNSLRKLTQYANQILIWPDNNSFLCLLIAFSYYVLISISTYHTHNALCKQISPSLYLCLLANPTQAETQIQRVPVAMMFPMTISSCPHRRRSRRRMRRYSMRRLCNWIGNGHGSAARVGVRGRDTERE